MRTGENAPKKEKREAILQAALELVAEHGLQHTPMSLISKRSGASAGIIYHYFESKEDLFASLYRQVKGDMGNAIVASDDPQQPLAKRFETLWLSIFRYCLAHPQEMAFLEQYESIPKTQQQEDELRDGTQTFNRLLDALSTSQVIKSLSPEEKMLYGLIADLRAQDLLKDLPMMVIGELTLGVALRLARRAKTLSVRFDEAMLTSIARACWDAIVR